MIRTRPIVTFLIACAGVSGCTSPEATRTRGGGPGADVGNRSKVVAMHEGSKPFWNTPVRIPVVHAPPDSASQADRLRRK
jgi:hypothetical protein